MTFNTFIFVAVSVTMSALAQTSFKFGLKRVVVADDASAIMKVIGVFSSPYVFLGLSLYGMGTVLWLLALKKTELSQLYPFVSMSFIIVFLLGVFVLDEAFSSQRLTGTILIVLGLIFIARS